MGYGSINVVKKLLANALTSATPDTLDTVGDLLNVGNTLDVNLITTELVEFYMRDADSYINATINQLYVTPLKKIADIDFTLTSDIDEYNSVITLNESGVLVPGDTLVFYDGASREEVEIASIADNVITLAESLGYTYSASNTRVVRIGYSNPIPYISGRLTAANIYDKYFSAQADKNESQYGKFFRNLARIQLSQILAGVTILHGVHRIGHLTMNPNLRKRYGTPEGTFPEGYKIEDAGR